MAKRSYYLHTIDGRAAFYVPGEQICYMNHYGDPSPLVESLEQIRREQKSSHAWCRKHSLTINPDEYGYRRVCLP